MANNMDDTELELLEHLATIEKQKPVRTTLSQKLMSAGIEPIEFIAAFEEIIGNYNIEPELDMNPPAPSKIKYTNPFLDLRRLRLQNIDEYIVMDDVDFQKAKYTTWYLIDGVLKNPAGVSFEEYVGITGTRISTQETYNYCRSMYI